MLYVFNPRRALLQRLATGATGMKQARYRRGPTHGAARHSTSMRSIIHSLLVLGTCCSMHGEFRQGFCTLVLL